MERSRCFALVWFWTVLALLVYVIIYSRLDVHVLTNPLLKEQVLLNGGCHHSPVVELPWTTIRDGGNSTPQFFSAYYDDRDMSGRPAVVVLGYHPLAVSNMTMYCKLTFSSKTTSTVCLKNPAIKTLIYGNSYVKNRRSKPTEYICQLECKGNCTDESIPVLVALSSIADCTDASADIPVRNRAPRDPTRMKGFGVCVETPLFRKNSQQFTEFVEMNRALGARHITFYVIHINKQLHHFFSTMYCEDDLVEVVKWRNLGAWTEMHYYGELLIMQDCLYRHMNRVKYVAFEDMDELILPLNHSNWSDMMAVLDTSPKRGAFLFLNTYFTNNPKRTGVSKPCKQMNVPIYFKWTRRYLCKYQPHRRSKFIAKPRLVNALDIHAVSTLRGYFEYTVPYHTGASAHYRYQRTSDCTNTNTTVDTTALKYQSQVMRAVEQKICSHS